MSEIAEISQKLLGKEFPTELNGVVTVLMYWMKGEMQRTSSVINKKNIKLIKDISKLKKQVSLLQDKIQDLEAETSTTEMSDSLSTEDNVLKTKSKIVRKRKVRIPKNAKHLQKTSPKSSSDEEPKNKKYSKILVTQYQDACLIHGSTYEHREVIKKYHGKWTKDMKGWIVPKELKDELTGELKTYITNIIENTIDEYLEKKQPSMNTSYVKTNNSCLIDSDSD